MVIVIVPLHPPICHRRCRRHACPPTAMLMGSLHLHHCGLPGPLQDVVLPQIVPPGHHDASHEPLLFVEPAPREGPTIAPTVLTL
jgi:hypothetical protein